MIKIGIISDTHGYLDPKVLDYFNDVDEIWHAGDIGSLDVTDQLKAHKPLRAVYGNIDNQLIRSEFRLNEIFILDKLKVLITHIAGYPGTYSNRVKELIIKHQPQLVVCGHSHILKVMKDPVFNHLHMNPGAAGVHGFHIKKTLIRFEIHSGIMKNLEVIELGDRAKIK